MISNQEKNLFEKSKDSLSNENLLNAPKPGKKIPILIPEPLDLNDYSFENEEDDFNNLSYIKSEDDQININLFSSWSTKASDDEMGKSESNINNINEKIDCQKKITIFELLKKSSKL